MKEIKEELEEINEKLDDLDERFDEVIGVLNFLQNKVRI